MSQDALRSLVVPKVKGFTKSGEPRMGARFMVRADGLWEIVKVVAKNYGTVAPGQRGLRLVWLEWDDGSRSPWLWPELLDALSPVETSKVKTRAALNSGHQEGGPSHLEGERE